MTCKEESIEICAKGRGLEAIVSLRQNELIQNLRALVAVRFELAISQIVLVFAGEVLRDVGTIDSRGIISGVTVHVVCRPELPVSVAPVDSSFQLEPQPDPLRSRAAATIARVLGHPRLLRNLFQADPRIRCLIERDAALRHFLNSDKNLREVVLQVFGPARQEMERRRDLYHLRLELVPGGYKLLGRLSYLVRQAYENNVAKTFQRARPDSDDGTNPQRGLENKQPLPNPWLLPVPWNNMDAKLRSRRNRVIKAIRAHHLFEEREFAEEQENATSPPPTPSVRQKKATTPPPTPVKRTVRHVYQAQLDELVQKGYTDRHCNLRALQISLGNVDSAVRLLDHWNRSRE
ncbi:ubiquilin-1 [Drosophila kikkawai]|uniref:Ubiquilin-1 n=1 Tax=Drosophila kikkawai TaxID=30033 RepID=A0A6P4IUZ1_DROKI|nr:ubiquilin-1 [Drosophila kikkawai]